MFTEPANTAIKIPRICCVTAYNSEKVKERAIASGMDSFYSKPIFKQDLFQELYKAGLIDLAWMFITYNFDALV